jgi:methionine sulfoxide reductase catalytic subunit
VQFEPPSHLHRVPLRLRFANQLVFKMVKWIQAIEFVENMHSVYKGAGGYNENHEYFGELAKTWRLREGGLKVL